MRLLDWLGSPFVYRSPKPTEGFISFLPKLSNRQLRAMVGTTSHLSKKKLIDRYLRENSFEN